MKNMIEITGVNLNQFVKDVYDLSVPQGLGFLHATNGPLSDNEVNEILGYGDNNYPINMDYINGRACKMTVFREGKKLFINENWYDHTDKQLSELLERNNISFESDSKHGLACNCSDCRLKQGKSIKPTFGEVVGKT